MSEDKSLDLSTAKNAFNTFFKTVDGKVSMGQDTPDNPANKVLNRVSAPSVNSDGTITKVDATDNSVKTMSTDEAKAVADAPKSFDDVLKDLKIQNSDLFEIIDCYLEKGYYEKKFQIKSLEYAFQSKKVYSISHITDTLDGVKYTSNEAVDQLYYELSLAASLVYFKMAKSPAMVFQHDSIENDETALKFVRTKLHSPILAILIKELNKFEMMVGLAVRDEAINRFLARTTD